MTNLAIVVAVLLAMAAVGLAIWLVPRRQVNRWRRAGISSEEKLAELGVQARSSITQAFGGLALIVTLAITAFQANETRRSADETQRTADNTLRLAEQGQVSERFSRAVEQLGATNEGRGAAIDVRTGALFSLMRIALDSETNAQPAFLVAATYVRNNYLPPKEPRPHGCDADFTRQQPDIATALTFVLPAVAAKLHKDTPGLIISGFRGTRLDGLALDGLVLNGLNLTGIKFRDASLVRAHFRKSVLSSAIFARACLRDADFRGASLRGADFRGAQLEGAKFSQGALDDISLSKAQRDVIVVSP